MTSLAEGTGPAARANESHPTTRPTPTQAPGPSARVFSYPDRGPPRTHSRHSSSRAATAASTSPPRQAPPPEVVIEDLEGLRGPPRGGVQWLNPGVFATGPA